MQTQTFEKPRRAHFRFGVWNVEDMPLHYEMFGLRRSDENKNYWFAASFVCDKITYSANGIALYHIRRKGMKKADAIMLQSDWPGVDYLFIDGIKEGCCDM